MNQSELAQHIQQLIANGKIIQAIKLLRTAKNIDLNEAKSIVNRLRTQVVSAKKERNTLRAKGEQPTDYTTEKRDYDVDYQHTSHSHSIEKELPTEVYLLLQQGEKVAAIKSLRDIKGLGHAEANNLVNIFYQRNPQYTLVSNKKNSALPTYIVFVMFAVIAYRIFTG